tara:strand:- start:733 stop:1095 length:363 start_codon:yes stop_codon:yes gene_type:complete
MARHIMIKLLNGYGFDFSSPLTPKENIKDYIIELVKWHLVKNKFKYEINRIDHKWFNRIIYSERSKLKKVNLKKTINKKKKNILKDNISWKLLGKNLKKTSNNNLNLYINNLKKLIELHN